MIELIPTTVVRMALTGDDAEGVAYLYLQPATEQQDKDDNLLYATPNWDCLHVHHLPDYDAPFVTRITANEANMLALSAVLLGHMTGTNPWEMFNTAPTDTLMSPISQYEQGSGPPIPNTASFHYPTAPQWIDKMYLAIMLSVVGESKPVVGQSLNFITTQESV